MTLLVSVHPERINRSGKGSARAGDDGLSLTEGGSGAEYSGKDRSAENRCECRHNSNPPSYAGPQPMLRKAQYSSAAIRIDAGNVSTQASARLRIVPIWRPDRLAAIVPATPEESTCVVLTGRPNMSAALMVAMAVI